MPKPRSSRRWTPLRLAVGTLALATLGAPCAFAQENGDWASSPAVGLGPLQLRAQSPLAILRLSPTPDTPATLREGELQLGLLTSWNNYFDYDPPFYTIDAEMLRFTLRASYGLTPRLELHAALPLSYRGGGIMDRFIENFEGLLGVPNETRKQAPRNRYLILIRGPNGTTFERSGGDAGWGLEDATAGLKFQIARGTATTPAVTASFVVKAPIGREASLFSSGGWDVAAGLSAGQRLGRFNLYGSFVAMHYATTDLAGVALEPTQTSFLLALEYRHSPRTSWLLQTLTTSPGAKRFGGFSKSTYEVTFGYKHVLDPQVMLEASLLENLFIFDNSPDVGFHVGLLWRSKAVRRR
jgi:hypothetical protein